MTARLQSWIQADPHFQRSDALSLQRVILSHPVLRRYYLGERVDLQIRGCRSVPYSPLEDMRSGKQMTLTILILRVVHMWSSSWGEIMPSSAESFLCSPLDLGLMVFRDRHLPSRLAPILLGLRAPRLGLRGGGLRPIPFLPLRLRARLRLGLVAR
ncbi:hypothetical protein JCGZ_02786 [Jatropha curcas]|uniref:Uncharacterized protein n=1 Tax=Jatropha curcas TaxID=180498 RepID=A0A067JT41_JATCU|nr:hypothetical protein JCGZ_02786 [Jatropha curcas]